MLHAMIDLEALGTEHYSAITQVGVVLFDSETVYERGGPAGGREWNVDPGDAPVTAGSVRFWLDQPAAAREAMRECLANSLPIRLVLHELGEYLYHAEVDMVWAKPAHFDLFMLQCAYERCGMQAPWGFDTSRRWRGRPPRVQCMSQFFRGRSMPRRRDKGVRHTALADAVSQAHQVREALAKGGL